MVAAVEAQQWQQELNVSIPVRVLGWLQRTESGDRFNKPLVSIPVRVLGWLQRGRRIKFVIPLPDPVSIPVRVLGWLQRIRLQASQRLELVSIPVRVLGWLQHGFVGGWSLMFNPFQSL